MHIVRKLVLAWVCALAALSLAGSGKAGLDTGFGLGSTALLAPGTFPNSLVIDSLNRPVVAGFGTSPSGFVTRLSATGGDGAFGTFSTVGFATATPSAAVDTQNRVLAVGNVAGVATLWRLAPDGSPDLAFGTAGSVALPVSSGVVLRQVIVDALDRPIVLGTNPATGVAQLVRVTDRGSLDPTFGSAGVLDLGPLHVSAAVAIGADGRLFVASATFGNAVVKALTPSGGLDVTFGASGVAAIDRGGDETSDAVAVDASGRVLLGGTSVPPGAPPTAGVPFVARLSSTGSLDRTFGSGGTAVPPLPSGTGGLLTGLAVGPAARVAVTLVTFGAAPGGVLAVFASDGTPDPGYVDSGMRTTPDFDTAVAFDPAGRLLVAGQFMSGTHGGFVQRFVLTSDTTPPELHVADVTAEATGPSGASVSYTATATDAVDGAVTPSCAPASGALFPLGPTTVSCTASDSHGNTATGSFVVTVVDTTAPLLVVADIAVDAESPAGVAVSYTTVSASDVVDGKVTPGCTPTSGSAFAIGDTTVTCTATDAHGNISPPASFTVHVRGAQEQLDALTGSIDDRQLLKKLDGVDLSSPRQACVRLEQFARAALREIGGDVGNDLASRARRIEVVAAVC